MSNGKTVSDILRHEVIFPNGREESMSAVFEVRNHPVMLKAYNMGCDTTGFIEMGHHDGCGGWTWTPFSPVCDQILLTACSNVVAMTVPGRYRVVFRNRITDQLETGLDDLLITVTETDMPAPVLANYGGSTMACGNRVSIHVQENGCFIINVDDVPYTICPGSDVSCSPEGGGVIIDGVLCPFPNISFSEDDGCLVINSDGEIFTWCPPQSPDSVTTASIDEDQVVTITNPDGSTVSFRGSDHVTTASIDEDQVVTITNPDNSTVSFQGSDHVTTASVDENGIVTITNPDGSTLSFDGNNDNSITIADIDEAAGTVTITNPDGSEITFQYASTSTQTIVSRGSGSNVNKITADHGGTAPNVSWRMPTLERDGDIVTITIWDENDIPDSVQIYAPEDLLYLIDPVFYIRQATGVPNPPINSQSDLTVANAFDDWSSLRTFIGRTIIIGSVTVDARGVFETVTEARPENYAGAVSITYRGDSANPAAFTARWDNDPGASSNGIAFSGGANGSLRDVTLEQMDAGFALNSEQSAVVARDANLTLRGQVVFKGFSDVDANPSGKTLLRASGGAGYIQLGIHNASQSQSLSIVTNYDVGSKLSAFLFVTGRAGCDFADVTVSGNATLDFSNRPVRVGEGSRAGYTVSPFAGNKQPIVNVEFTTNGVKAIPNSATTLSSVTTSRFGVAFPEAMELVYPWLTPGTDIVGRLDKYSSIGGTYGTDLMSNPRYQVI